MTGTHYKDWPNAAGFNALDDQRTKTELVVSGNIPEYAAGTLYRTGPGGYKVSKENGGEIAASHWFDGYTVVHKFDITPGTPMKVVYSSYNQVDELVEQVRKSGRIAGLTFGQKRDPCDGLFKKIKTMFAKNEPGTAHTANIGVALRETTPLESKGNAAGGRKIMTVTTDSPFVKHFDAETLEPLGVTDQTTLNPLLKGQLSAAHAAHDPQNGDIFNYNLEMGPASTYRIFKATLSGDVEILATVKGQDVRGSYIHSLLLTENYVVLCIWSAYYQMSGVSILWNRNLLDAIAPFDKSSKVTWLVVDRRHGRGLVKKFSSPAFFSFHTVNAWEERSNNGGVDIICELIEYQNLDILHKFYYHNMTSDGSGVGDFDKTHLHETSGLARYKLADITSAASKPQVATAEKVLYRAAPTAGDLPRINPHYATKRHRYVWGIISRRMSSFIDGIVKTDTQTDGPGLIWDCPKHTPGEPIFIPRPGATEEDDGVILTIVLNGETGTSYLLCLDAQNMKEIGRAEVGTAVGFGFHGKFVPEL